MPGIREEKRRETDRRLAQAAYELAASRGVDGFTIADVVRSAGYARRTFAYHFSCKEEAVAASALAYDADIQRLLATLHPSAPVIDAVRAVMTQQFTAEMLDRLRSIHRLSADHPGLRPHLLATLDELRHRALRALSAWSDDRYPALYLPLLFGAVYGAASAVLEGQVDVSLGSDDLGPAAMAYDDFVDTVFHYVSVGF